MIITVDGYDGTGKTTLAKKLSEKYGFIYMQKPFVKKYQIEHNCSYEEAVHMTGLIEKKLYKECSHSTIAAFYLSAIEWISMYSHQNIILDRGLLTSYAVLGDAETTTVFEGYVRRGAFHDASVYLTAKDEERVKRIYENNPNDPDLNYPIKWRDNDLESFANRMNLNYHTIDTNDKTPEEVFIDACLIVDNELSKQKGSVKVLCKKEEDNI